MPGPGSRRDAGAHAAVAPPEPLSTARWLTAAPPLVNKATPGLRPASRHFQAQLVSWPEPVRAHMVTYVVSRAGGPQRGASAGGDLFDVEELSFLKTSTDQLHESPGRARLSSVCQQTRHRSRLPRQAATWRTQPWVSDLDF